MGPHASCPGFSLAHFITALTVLIFVVSPSLTFAQAGPMLSYSTYLPTIHFQPLFVFGGPAILSVNSTGAACVTDGISLYGYDSNGKVTFTISDIVALTKTTPTSVFQDEQDNCFLTGQGPSTGNFQDSLGIAKLSASGALIYATSFAGPSNPGFLGVSTGRQIVADLLGNGYVIGNTNVSDFPLKNPIQNLLMGKQDAVVLKVDSTGKNLIYSTYFGADVTGSAIAIDSSGNAYITGGTNPSGGTIPVKSAFQSSPQSAEDAFVAKIDPNGVQVYGTYLGGSSVDFGFGIAADNIGNAYAAGDTCSTDFPTKNAFQSAMAAPCGGGNASSGFLTKISADGSSLVYSTFLGGTDGLTMAAIAVDDTGAPYVTGTAAGAHFPLANPIQSDFLNTSGGSNGITILGQTFVTAFNSAGSALQYSTFLGGFNRSGSTSIGVDKTHNVYFAGGNFPDAEFISSLEGFPLLAASNGVFQPFFVVCHMVSCASQGFLAKISPASGSALASPSTVDFATVKKGSSSPSVAVLIGNVGSTDLTINNTSITGDYNITNNTCSGSLLSSKHCEVDVVFGPTAGGTRTGVLTLTSTAPDSPRNIQLTGIGGVPIVSLNPTSLNLTSPGIGAAGPSQTVALSNTGADTLNITSLTITGPNAADFSETHDCASTLAAGSSCNVHVTYKASTSNTETASVQIVDNAAGSPHNVALTGTVSAFGLTTAPGSSSTANVSAGQVATYNLMIGGQGFGGNVTLSCSGAPAAATCAVPSSESLSSTPTNFQATVNTTARSSAALPPSHTDPRVVSALMVLLFGLPLLLLSGKRRTARILALASACLCVALISSCGGGGGSSAGQKGTPAGTFALTVTATNGTTSQSVNLTLNVN